MSGRGKPTPLGRAPSDTERAELRAAKALYESIHSGAQADTSNFDELLGHAEWMLTKGRFDSARDYALEALQIASDDEKSQALDMIGQALQALGDNEGAKNSFLEAEKYDPEGSFERLLSLAQMHEGQESLGFYQQGLQLALGTLKVLTPKKPSKQKKNSEAQAERAQLRFAISNIYCSMAELYLTDLCDEDNAESQCEYCLQQAVMTCPNNSEGYRLFASLKLTQGHKEQACQYALQAQKMVLKAMERQSEELSEFSARAELAKMLLELNLCQAASDLFDELITEKPIYVELWYYRAVSLINLANESQENLTENCYAAAHHLLRAKKMLNDDPDEEMIASVEAQLANLASIGVDLERVEAEVVIEMAVEQGNPIEEKDTNITDAEILAIAEEQERELQELDQQRETEEEFDEEDNDEDEDFDVDQEEEEKNDGSNSM